MDQNTAKRLLEEGGILIFLGVPVGTEFGIDFKSWVTDEKFRGIKMIPPGVHFIHFSPVTNTGDVAPRSGFFYNFRKEEILVRKWDSKENDICSEKGTDEETSNFRHNIKTMDSFLGAYPFDVYEKWTSLTDMVTAQLVNQLVPLSGVVRSALELEGCSDADRPRAEKSDAGCSKAKRRRNMSDTYINDIENKLLPEMKPKMGTELRLTQFPEKHYPEGSSAADITQHSMDLSYVFESVISNYNQATDIIGELQFSFICFLIGHSLEAFEHWKKLINLFCSCESAITKYRRVYHYLPKILRLQVAEIPEEFLADIVSNNNFFYVKTKNLFRNIQASNVDGQLKNSMRRFEEFLTKSYSWDFAHLDSEDEENAPVVVNLEDHIT